MNCTACRNGTLRDRVVAKHDVGNILGLPSVVLLKATLLVCPKCGEIHVPGEVIGAAIPAAAAKIVAAGDLTAKEAKFLREFLDLTQGELAERMDVSRATVARWESEDSTGGANPLALRALVAMHLLEKDPSLTTELAHLFSKPGPKATSPREYRLKNPLADRHAG
jgi:DNA-binding transcriptional regulator YiaG